MQFDLRSSKGLTLADLLKGLNYKEVGPETYLRPTNDEWEGWCYVVRDKAPFDIRIGVSTQKFLKIRQQASNVFSQFHDDDIRQQPETPMFALSILHLPFEKGDLIRVRKALEMGSLTELEAIFNDFIHPFLESISSYKACLQFVDAHLRSLPLYPTTKILLLAIIGDRAELKSFGELWIKQAGEANPRISALCQKYLTEAAGLANRT